MKSKKNLKLILTGLLLASLFISSCRSLESRGKTNYKQRQAPQAEVLIKQLLAVDRAIKSVEAFGKLDVKTEDHKDSADLTWIIEKPDKLTFELTGPTGLLAVVTIDKNEFRYFDIAKKRILIGPVTKYALAKVLPWSFDLAELIPIFLGSPKLLDTDNKTLKYDQSQKRWRLTLVDQTNGVVQGLWFNGDNSLYRAKLVNKESEVFYDVTYLGWKKRGQAQILYPSFIKIIHPPSKTSLTLKLNGIPEINTKIPKEVFKMDIPDHIMVEEIPGSPVNGF